MSTGAESSDSKDALRAPTFERSKSPRSERIGKPVFNFDVDHDVATSVFSVRHV